MIRVTTSTGRVLAAAGLALGLAIVRHEPGEAHKAITSKFFFNENLFPLFRDKCGRCHVDGGVAPMSLLTHEDAAPWAESLRLEFLSEDPPPPWHEQLRLSPRELDMMLVWANGGTPRGDASKPPPAVPLVNTWVEGAPDVALPMATAFAMEGATNEAMHEVTWPLAAVAGKTFSAIDVLPGNPAIVRSATIAVKAADNTTRPLATWRAGHSTAVALAAPFTVPAGASLVARIEYKRTWKYEGQALTDTSTIGLYAAPRRTTAPAARR